MEVYDVDKSKAGWYNTACVNASRLLSNAKIAKRINELLAQEGLTEEFADKQLLFLMSQQEDKNVKLGALREFNRIKERVKPDRLSIEIKPFDHIDKLISSLLP